MQTTVIKTFPTQSLPAAFASFTSLLDDDGRETHLLTKGRRRLIKQQQQFVASLDQWTETVGLRRRPAVFTSY